jgi:hypothetical protein
MTGTLFEPPEPTRLTFSPGNHSYYLRNPDGKKERLPSVTTLLGLLEKPALKRWAANTAADYATDHWDELTGMRPSERRTAIASAPWAERDRAAASGTAIHALAEQLLSGAPVEVPAEIADKVEAVARFLERAQLTKVATECMVWSAPDDELGLSGYAGTFDLLADHPMRGACLIDWKSGRGVYGEHAVQLAGYATADWLVREGTDTPMPWVDSLAVAHVRPDGVDLHVVAPDQVAIARERFTLLRALKCIPEPELRMELP